MMPSAPILDPSLCCKRFSLASLTHCPWEYCEKHISDCHSLTTSKWHLQLPSGTSKGEGEEKLPLSEYGLSFVLGCKLAFLLAKSGKYSIGSA